MNIEELKQKFLNNELEKGLFTTKNEKGQDVIVGVGTDGFQLSTQQSNGWTRINIYTYDKENKEWIYEESYEK